MKYLETPHVITGAIKQGSLIFCFLTAFLLMASGALAQNWIYTVRPGDNLWDLSEEHLSSMKYWRRLQQLNRVEYPRRMPPGMRLSIPIAWLKIQPATVRVLSIRGSVEVTVAATGRQRPLDTDLILRVGDQISTGPESNVTLEFADRSRMLVQADSHLVFDTISAYGKTGMVDTRLRLSRGRVSSQVERSRGPGTRYEIRTPAAASTVRGTDYRVTMEVEPPISYAEVIDGKVVVSARNRAVTVTSGFGTVTRTGKSPRRPVRLLSPPDVSAIPFEIDRVPIRVQLTPLDGAVAYRMQVAADEGFRALLFDETSDLPLLRGPDLPDGDYVLRVRGIDAQGLEGKDAYHRFRLDARPEPPVLLAPIHDSTVRDDLPGFEWARPENASGFRFQLAGDAGFESLILNLADYPKALLTPDRALPSGTYYWRVATRDRLGETGPFGDAGHFELKSAPPAPDLDEPEIKEDTMVFRWSSGTPGQSYQFQLARDRGFKRLLSDTLVSEPQLSLARPKPGHYYLRVRTVGTDGFAGPFGPPQRVNVVPTTYWPQAIILIIGLVFAL